MYEPQGPVFQPVIITPINPGHTGNFWDHDSQTLTQVQHQGDHVDIVTHFDHGPEPLPLHIVTRVNPDGSMDDDY